MASSLPSASKTIFIIRSAVAISYFTLMVLFYSRAPPASGLKSLGLVSHTRPLLKTAARHRSLGPFGEMMVSMLGPTDAPFTIFVPSEAAFLNFSSSFRKIVQKDEPLNPEDSNPDTYAVLSHLLSFGTVPKPIFSTYVPVKQEAVHETLSGFLLSLSRVPDRGLLVNNLTCAVTDLERGRFVIHIVDGVLMDPEFAQSMAQERAPSSVEDTREAGAAEEEAEEQKEAVEEQEDQTDG